MTNSQYLETESCLSSNPSLSGQSNLSLSWNSQTFKKKKVQLLSTALSIFSDSAENSFIFQMHATWDYPQEKENHRELSSCVFTNWVHSPKQDFLLLISKITHHITRKAAVQCFDWDQITFLQVSLFTLLCHIAQESMHFQETSPPVLSLTQQSLDSWQYPRETPAGWMFHPSSGCMHPTHEL